MKPNSHAAKLLPFVEKIAEEAGKKLIRYSKKVAQLKVSSKKAEGMVSEADVQTEAFIQKQLKKIFKEADFLGEESTFINFKDKRKAFLDFSKLDWCWVVDPLDGTHNFLSGLDYYGVCISLVHCGLPVLGVVYRPETGAMYTALLGKGAFKKNLITGKKTRMKGGAKSRRLRDTMVVTGFALEKGVEDPSEFRVLKKVMRECRGVRRFGSAALDMCHVAEGKFDGFWEKGLSPWDVAASGIICTEAGLKVTDYKGNAFHPFQNSIICSSRTLHRKFIGLF